MARVDADTEETARRARAEARRGRMTLRRGTLHAPPEDPDVVRGEAALSLVYQLTRTCWSLGRLPEPTCARSETPIIKHTRVRA